jgi:hypothetical protein
MEPFAAWLICMLDMSNVMFVEKELRKRVFPFLMDKFISIVPSVRFVKVKHFLLQNVDIVAEQLPDFGIFEKEGTLYCEKHYAKFFGFRCAQCGESIEDEFLTAIGQKWHLNCFRCHGSCGKPLMGDFMLYHNKPYCQEDYMAECVAKCAICFKRIEDTAIGADGKAYHVACIKCRICEKSYDGNLWTLYFFAYLSSHLERAVCFGSLGR